MSYCRFVEADIYVFLDSGGYLSCCGCSLGDDGHFTATAEMIAHVQKHIDNGDRVPDDVIPALERDAVRNDAYINGENV